MIDNEARELARREKEFINDERNRDIAMSKLSVWVKVNGKDGGGIVRVQRVRVILGYQS